MSNAWLLFKGDIQRLRRNTMTIIAIVGLVVLPSLFSWYNILACWNVFDNTGNLTVAVANSDDGYESDLVPLRVNIGEQVVSALRANDQLNWVITDEGDAVDGARSGRYYAAVVIPATFSADMMSFYSDDVEHAKITYYSNQKKSAIAPKVTDQGADQVSTQVNRVFAETISEIALSVAAALYDYAEDADVDGSIGQLAAHVSAAGAQMADAAAALSTYSAVLGSSQGLLDGSTLLLAQARTSADGVTDAARGAQEAAGGIVSALGESASALAGAIQKSAGEYEASGTAIAEAFADAASSAASASSLLREQGALADIAGDHERAQALYDAADAVDEANAATQASRDEAQLLADQARRELADARADYDEGLKPTLDKLAAAASDASAQVSATAALLDSATSELSGTAGSLSQKVSDARGKVEAATAKLNEASATLADLGQGMYEALESNDAAALRQVIGTDPAALASALAAPVQLERHAVYPAENFGSAMAPLYTTLALWIGALLVMVTLKLVPSEETMRELDDPSTRDVFVGRFGVVALISFAQSTFMSLGNLLFLGVQAMHPFLYVLCFWVSGLAFTFIIYTLVALFANLGKALSVILLIVQVSGGGGSFPLQLLPQFFQTLSPYLPITHAVRAMRAAMFGLYGADFWMELGVLALFTLPLVLLGLVLNKPLSKFVPKFVERVEASKLM